MKEGRIIFFLRIKKNGEKNREITKNYWSGIAPGVKQFKADMPW